MSEVCLSFCCLPTAFAKKVITYFSTVKKLIFGEFSLNCARPCSKAIWNSSINCCLFLQPDGTDLRHFVHEKVITYFSIVKKLIFGEFSLNCARRCSKAIWNSSVNCCLFLQPNGTDLRHFVHEHETWADYLTYMEQDGAWGDHLILCAAANCFKTCIHVVSSIHEVDIRPHGAVDESKPLVLGHIHEVHYVSLQPIQGKSGKAQYTYFSI